MVLAVRAKRAKEDGDMVLHSDLMHKSRVAIKRYMEIVILPHDAPVPVSIPDRHRTIESFSESDCWQYFETRKADLYRMVEGLSFPEECVLENRSVMSGEEVFLRGMYELVSGEKQYSIARNVFGRDSTQQSRAFTFFIDHIYSSHLHLLTDNLDWWMQNGFLEESRQAIERKLVQKGLVFDDVNRQNDCGFIDCNCRETARVGGGPRSGGPDAERWECISVWWHIFSVL
jgi:hypothetical protein